MELQVDDAAIEALEEEIDKHFSGDMDNWDGIMQAVRKLVPRGARNRIERGEGCQFPEWLDEVLYKWDGRSAPGVVELLQTACKSVL